MILRDIRQSKNINQTQLSEICNLSQTQISAIECGKVVPHYRTMQKIEAALVQSVDWRETNQGCRKFRRD